MNWPVFFLGFAIGWTAAMLVAAGFAAYLWRRYDKPEKPQTKDGHDPSCCCMVTLVDHCDCGYRERMKKKGWTDPITGTTIYFE